MTALMADTDRLGLLVAAVVALLLLLAAGSWRLVVWYEGWRDRRFLAEFPEVASFRAHVNSTPGMVDHADEWAEMVKMQPFRGASRDRALSGKTRVRARRQGGAA